MNKKLELVVDAIHKTKGEDIMIYDFTSLNPFVDQMVITHGDNLRQVFAIANNIMDELKQNGCVIRNMEGNKDSRWILIDADDIVVHVFLDEERALYKLERLYADLPIIQEDAHV